MTKGLRPLGGAFAMLIAMGPGVSLALPGPGLKGLEPGEWELRERGAEADPVIHRLCLSDLRQLIQVQHPRHSCKGLTVDEGPHRLSVSYDCGGAGGGRTDLRVETPRLVQLRSQGIANGAPFSFAMEGRRLGACR